MFANSDVPNTPDGSFYNQFGKESKLDFIKRHLEGDAVDMTRAFANNPENNDFLNECFNVACELGYINTVTQMLQYPPLCDRVDNHNAYYAGKGGNLEIIKMVTEACVNSYTIKYKKSHTTTTTTPYGYEKRVWLSCIGGACKGGHVDTVKFYFKKLRSMELLTYFGIFVEWNHNFDAASESEWSEIIDKFMKNGVMYQGNCAEVTYSGKCVYCF